MKYWPFTNNRSRFFTRLLISTVLPCLLATVLLALIFLPLMRKTADTSDEARAKVALDAAAAQFAGLYDTAAEMTDVVQYNGWIHSLYLDMLNGKGADGETRAQIIRSLNMACVGGGAKSFSFKFYDSPVLYNNRSIVDDLERYREIYRDDIQYFFTSTTAQTVSFSTVVFENTPYILYQAPFRDIEGGRYKGEVNILFPSGMMEARLDAASPAGVSAFRLTDAAGNVLWEYRTGTSDERSTSFTRASSDGNFIYSIDLPVLVYHRTHNATLPVVIQILLVTFVLSILLSYILSRISYHPVQNILTKYVGSNEGGGEFTALEHAFDRILAEKSEMESAVIQLKPLARQKVLGALLDGSASLIESFGEQLESCQIRFPHENFSVIALEIPFSVLRDRDMAQTAELAMEALLAHLSGQIPVGSWLYYLDTDHYRILVNYEKWDQLQSYISALTANCRNTLQNAAQQEGLYIGISQAVFTPDEIFRAAEQAETALNLAVLNHLEQPMFYSEAAPALRCDYYYPLSEEILLARAITGGSSETAKELLAGIIAENRQKVRLDPKSLISLFLDLSFTAARTGRNLGIELPPADPRETLRSLDEVEGKIAAMIDRICEEILARHNSTMSGMERQIMEYIDEHIFDPDLSLNAIAERFGRSTTYVSLLFKEQRGTNYNNYVNQTRILRAVQLMDEKGLDSSAVYPMVGYVSLSTFRRNFQKYAGSTPGGKAPERGSAG